MSDGENNDSKIQIRKSIRGMKPYTAIHANGLRLDNNTNVVTSCIDRKFFDEFDEKRVQDYPSMHADKLREKLAQQYKLDADNFIVGNGADDIFDIICKTFLNPGDKVVQPVPTYAMYKIYATINMGNTVSVPLHDDFTLDSEAIIKEQAKLVFIPSPANPTGNCMSQSAIEDIIINTPGIVVVDEAYAEFCTQNYMSRVNEIGNIIVTRTFSKVHGIAGMRIGYAAASREITAEMMRVKSPFNLNAVSEAAAIYALGNTGPKERYLKVVRDEKKYLLQSLENIGFTPYPSDANFVLARSPIDPDVLCAKLAKQNIYIRNVSTMPKLAGCIRITVADRGTMEMALHHIETAIEEVKG